MIENLLIGGKYRLESLIGSGGMGQVWVARHEVTGRKFAIKLLHPQAAAQNPQLITRLVQEARFSGMLRHPGIIEIYDVGTAPELNGATFLVMELLSGVSLNAIIHPSRGLPVRFTLHVALAIARALKAAHDKGVIHRDLKPANVFLHRDESGAIIPKLLDFGISKLASTNVSDSGSTTLTQTGTLLGSPNYMSPEQMANQRDIDGRSDLHALGVLVWCSLAGTSPFGVADVRTVLLAILSDPRPRLRDVRPDVPAGVSDFVSRAFARNRDDRYASAADAVAALEAELAKLGPGPTLASRDWVGKVLDGLEATTQSIPVPVPFPAAADGKETSAHRAVSLTVKPAADAATPPPSESGASASLAPVRFPRKGRVLLAVLAGLLVVLAVAGGLAVIGRPQRGGPASGTSDLAATNPSTAVRPPGAAANPSAAADLAGVVANPTAAPSALAPALATDGGAPADAVPPPAARSPRPPPASRPPARQGPASKPVTASDPFGGVTGTGL
jgi:serine/threonine-protein kinase